MNKGFTLIEILITILILGILSLITINYFTDLRQSKTLLGISEGISSSLEKKRSDAQAGKNGLQHGIKFNSDSYIMFSGSTFDSDDSNNEEVIIDSSFEISTNLSNNLVVFSKVKGEPNNIGTITVSLKNDPNVYKEITIGELGDVAVIE